MAASLRNLVFTVRPVTIKNWRRLPYIVPYIVFDCCEGQFWRGTNNVRKCFSTSSKVDESVSREQTEEQRQGMGEHFDMSQSFQKTQDWRNKLLESMLVYPNFVSVEEEGAILKEIEPYISRLHYETSHWDDAIHHYRETERAKWNHKNTEIINRIRSLCFPPGVPQLRFVHILDLAKTGVIKPHIDSVRFCGNTIAGLSLLSDSIMRLRHDVQKDFYCDVLLPRFSLYVMSRDFVRYEFTHEILGEKDSKFKDRVICRDRRISVICRNEPEPATSSSVTGPEFKPLSPPEQ
ncbi:Alpha-ketoglutarate-dependent dioxygenase alkB 7, mitochondrial [Orchesella cincta]|uniref:Alpha-ketoglutarate-dependent dioxygenase alkB 7, mitochondrial n=1 Tax=Orchesella cincta TaxID=48709 RepID=A0A1D2N8S5_ORCCI|nr:Alpha-ketoglutarate-dependent dioxygenase alkB 7, mitochondrial [Orchesella cincta]